MRMKYIKGDKNNLCKQLRIFNGSMNACPWSNETGQTPGVPRHPTTFHQGREVLNHKYVPWCKKHNSLALFHVHLLFWQV